jgi:hypothetical protein
MAERTTPLKAVASIIRSKNAGPYRITFDILFPDDDSFRHVVEARVVTRESVARAFGIEAARISSLFEVPMGRAIKITLVRPLAQGEIGESDMYGCQQHVPLMELPVPEV